MGRLCYHSTNVYTSMAQEQSKTDSTNREFVFPNKLRAGKYLLPATFMPEGTRVFVKFQYSKELIAEIKNMDGSKWHPEKRMWSILNNARNRFQLDYLANRNPYAIYDSPLIEYTPRRSLYTHQINMVRHILTRRRCLIAGEMGTGKSLVAIEAMESVAANATTDFSIWWVSTKTALKSVELELRKWNSRLNPELMTYDRLRETVKTWVPGMPAPDAIILDESSRIKTPTAQRSQAAMHVADALRVEHPDGYIVLMSGSPAPKNPSDWYYQVEVACPGFLKEGNIIKFKQSLGLIVNRESLTGGVYPHLITWRDDARKCDLCGEFADAEIHSEMEIALAPAQPTGKGATFNPNIAHQFKPSVNEVERLGKRLSGLVITVYKKDCLDLPDKVYRTVECEVSASTLRAAKMIVQITPGAAQALTLLRELSDGFQYVDVETGEVNTCPGCSGTGIQHVACSQICDICKKHESEHQGAQDHEFEAMKEERTCGTCGGKKTVVKTERIAKTVPTPKEDALIELLEEHEDVGRIVIYAGFTGSIDRCVDICLKQKWCVLRCDGRGWMAQDVDGTILDTDECLMAMDGSHPKREAYAKRFEKLAFVGHPASSGMGLTLTASPTIVYYSNDFNSESRIQSEDRIHRLGMDKNLGANIIDLLHLPTDQYVLDNLKKKRELQKMSMDEIRKIV